MRLLLGVIAHDLSNLLRQLVLPVAIQNWSLTSTLIVFTSPAPPRHAIVGIVETLDIVVEADGLISRAPPASGGEIGCRGRRCVGILIGVDLDGDQQVTSWEIKNTIDQALQLRRTHTETLTITVPEGTKAMDIEAILTYHRRPGEEFVVHRVTKKLAIKK